MIADSSKPNKLRNVIIRSTTRNVAIQKWEIKFVLIMSSLVGSKAAFGDYQDLFSSLHIVSSFDYWYYVCTVIIATF